MVAPALRIHIAEHIAGLPPGGVDPEFVDNRVVNAVLLIGQEPLDDRIAAAGRILLFVAAILAIDGPDKAAYAVPICVAP